MECWSVREIDEIKDEYSNEILHKNNNNIIKINLQELHYSPTDFFVIWMELAMQIVSNDKTVGSNTVQDLQDFNS